MILHHMCSHIRISADQCLFAAPRSFSQLVTSFFGSWCQGILLMLFFAWTSCKTTQWVSNKTHTIIIKSFIDDEQPFKVEIMQAYFLWLCVFSRLFVTRRTKYACRAKEVALYTPLPCFGPWFSSRIAEFIQTVFVCFGFTRLLHNFLCWLNCDLLPLI